MVTLPSNPTTGYSWEMVEQGEDAAVLVVAKEFRTSYHELSTTTKMQGFRG